MTNRKFKDYHKNKLCYDVILDNFKMLCIIMLTLHDLFPHDFYPKKMQEWLENYSKSCRLMDGYENDSIYDYKMEQFVNECDINSADCVKIVHKHLSKYNKENTNVLAENVKLALVQLAYDYGFGETRLKRVINALLETDRSNAAEEIKKFGIDYEPDFSAFDYRKLVPKKKKVRTTIAEEQKAKKDLAWLKSYQDSVMNAGGINNG